MLVEDLYLYLTRKLIFFYLAQQPQVEYGLLSHEVSRLHTTTHHSR